MKLTYLRTIALFMWAAVLMIGIRHGFAAGACMFAIGSLALEGLRNRPQSARLCDYTGTTLTELFIPEIYGDIQEDNRVDTNAFVQSGVAVTNPILQAAAQSGTKKVEVPVWNDLDASGEPNYSDESDDDSTPNKVGTFEYDARNSYMNNSWGATDLTAEIGRTTPGQGDPMTRIKNRIGAYWVTQFESRVLAVARGVMAQNIANDGGDMCYDVSLQTTVGQSAANRVSNETVTAAAFTMGDQFAGLRAIAMHSVIYHNLVNQQLIAFIRDAEGTLLYSSYLGLRIILDDKMPVIPGTTSGLRYVTMLFGAGVIGYGEGSPKIPTEIWREPTKGMGAGREQLIDRKTWMIHPAGHSWTDNTVSGGLSPTMSDLKLAANWDRKFERKKIQLAFLITNG